MFDTADVPQTIVIPLKERNSANNPQNYIIKTLMCNIERPHKDSCWKILWFKDGVILNFDEERDHIDRTSLRLIWESDSKSYFSYNQSPYRYSLDEKMPGLYWCEFTTCRPYRRYRSKGYNVIFSGKLCTNPIMFMHAFGSQHFEMINSMLMIF